MLRVLNQSENMKCSKPKFKSSFFSKNFWKVVPLSRDLWGAKVMHLEPKLDPAGPCSVNTEFLHLIYKQF